MKTVDTWDLEVCGRLKATSYSHGDYFSMCVLAPGLLGGPSPLLMCSGREKRKREIPQKEIT